MATRPGVIVLHIRGVDTATKRRLRLAQAREGDRNFAVALDKMTRLYEVIERAGRGTDEDATRGRRWLAQAGFTAESD